MITCHYCDAPLTKAYENDHFPIPERHGGIDQVKTCIPCHDLKDRFSFGKWPPRLISTLIKKKDFEMLLRHFDFQFCMTTAWGHGLISNDLWLRDFDGMWINFEELRIAHWPDLQREQRILIARLGYILQDIKARCLDDPEA